ncbi:MAG: conjugative transposon protein TraK [Agriterribacter sp.]
MFRVMKNIDSAFRHIRLFSVVFLCACTVISVYALYLARQVSTHAQNKVYVLASGKAIEAYASERKENLAAEAKDHVQRFHELFFNVSPDHQMIHRNISRALYLADRSAKQQYDNLKENGFYTQVISGNIHQELYVDSVTIHLERDPFFFRMYATLEMVRPTSIATRSLITEGDLRMIARSENNAHGLLIERWTIVENKDIKIKSR